MDFTAAFENADGLLKNWPTYTNTIVSFLNDENHVKEKGIRSILAKITNEDLSESKYYRVTGLQIFIIIFAPTPHFITFLKTF